MDFKLIPTLVIVRRELSKAGHQYFTFLGEEGCEQSCTLFGLNKQDLIDHVKIVGAPTLNDRALEADGILSF